MFVALRIERHQAVRRLQGMHPIDEVSQQTPRAGLRGPSPPLRITRKSPARFPPYGLLEFEIDVDVGLRKKPIHKRFRGLGVGQQLCIDRRTYD